MESKLLLMASGAAAIVAGASLPYVGTSVASSALTPAGERIVVMMTDGSENPAPPATAKRDGLVRIATPARAEEIYQTLGSGAIWTYDPLTRKFLRLSTSSPEVGSALYVRTSSNAILKADIAASQQVLASIDGKTLATTPRRANTRLFLAVAPKVAKAPAVTTTTVAPTTTIPASATVAHSTAALSRSNTTKISTTTTTTLPRPATKPRRSATTTTLAPTTTTTTAAPTTTAVTPSSPEPLGVPGNWTLSFDDEFSAASLNAATWSPFWFANGDVSNGTVMEASNVSESGGYLNLALTGSSGALVSTNPNDGVPGHTGYQFTYGYFEARVDVPPSGNEIANWPAVWATGQVWPQDGELDVMEGLGGQACFHFHDSGGGPGSCVQGNMTGWHTFGALWVPGTVTYYYDGVDVGSISSGITSQPLYIVLENSASGTSAVVPSTMKVDYVRVWTSAS